MDIEASSEITVEDAESDAFEESTTHEQQREESATPHKNAGPIALPLDAWALIVLDLSVWDIGSSVRFLPPLLSSLLLSFFSSL